MTSALKAVPLYGYQCSYIGNIDTHKVEQLSTPKSSAIWAFFIGLKPYPEPFKLDGDARARAAKHLQGTAHFSSSDLGIHPVTSRCRHTGSQPGLAFRSRAQRLRFSGVATLPGRDLYPDAASHLHQDIWISPRWSAGSAGECYFACGRGLFHLLRSFPPDLSARGGAARSDDRSGRDRRGDEWSNRGAAVPQQRGSEHPQRLPTHAGRYAFDCRGHRGRCGNPDDGTKLD